jgi:hypothetical protein
VDVDGIKTSLQKELEASGIPVSLSCAAAQILAEENRKSSKTNPSPQEPKNSSILFHLHGNG